MNSSLYNSATGTQAPHCIHAVGIGRTGAVYIEALLRTGEVEDLLEDSRATFAAMVVDIGDQDMQNVIDYANSFRKRLASRGFRPSASTSRRSHCRYLIGTSSLRGLTARVSF